MMKIHVQNVSQSQESNGFAAVIHGIAQPTQMDKPFIVEIGLNSSESKPLTEIHVRASSPSEQVNKVVNNLVKSSILMPHCPACGQIFPLTLYPQLEAGKILVCEYCGMYYNQEKT